MKKKNLIGLIYELSLSLVALVCVIIAAIYGNVWLILASVFVFVALLLMAGWFLAGYLGNKDCYVKWLWQVFLKNWVWQIFIKKWIWQTVCLGTAKKVHNSLPTKRKLIQLYSALLFNANLKGFVNGKIYQGPLKTVCTPGLNCYSCPGASGACPLGSLQNALGSTEKRTPYYVFGIIVLYGILLGRFICGFLCPFGFIQELLYKIKTPKLKKNRFTKILSYFKYVLLVFLVGIVPVLYGLRNVPLPGFCKYVCPAGTIEGAFGLLSNKINEGELARLGPLFTWKFALAVSIILGSVFIFRVFCRFICPLGALYGLFNKISILGIKLDKPKCIDCGLCISKCKMDIHHVGDHECISCGECVSVCPTKAISWRGGKIILPPDEIAPVTPNMTEQERAACIENTEKRNEKLKKRRFVTRVVAAVVMVSLLVGALVYYNTDNSTATEEKTVYAPGDMCPSIIIPVYNGNGEYTDSFNPSENKGKVTVINFWGVWCPGCIKELPYFDQIATEFKDQVTVIAIHTYDELSESDEYIEEHFPNSDMLFGADKLTNGDTSAPEYFYSLLGGTGTYPITIIVNEDGEIFTLKTSELNYNSLKFLVNGALASNDK